TFWQLALASASNSGLDLTTLYEEPADFPPTSWLNFQVWRSLDQIWVGVDGDLVASVKDNRFGQGQVIIWVETGDLPLPLIKPVKINRWWCAHLSSEIETFSPFPSLVGRWVSKLDSWLLQAEKKEMSAVAILGATELPSWWVTDVKWHEEPMGLIFGWLNEKHYNLLRLQPEGNVPMLFSKAFLEIVAVRDNQEQVLDRFGLILKKDGSYRLALQLTENFVTGFINGMAVANARVVPVGKVGLWAKKSLALKQFWLYIGKETLIPLHPESGDFLQPAGEHLFLAHEVVSLTLPSGLPPNVPLSAKLSKEPVSLYVERRGNRLNFRLERHDQLLGTIQTKMPKQLPLIIRLERRDKLILVWLERQLVWTVRSD
ncbi:MAG: hypothetical protein NZ937_06035, partial [Armatimonadetes bacterium]|nr:hypothetical protein [Armatimonadota bacterium]